MKALVLGGAGFIGSHLVKKLVQHGHEVRVFVRPTHSLAPLQNVVGQIELARGDFGNRSDIDTALAGVEIVYHLIWSSLPQSSNQDPIFDVQSNISGALRLLELCVARRVRKVVFISSGGTVYGPAGAAPIKESAPLNPVSSYGVSKVAVENYLRVFAHLHGLDYTILRVANAYGEGQDARRGQGVVGAWLRRLERGQDIEIWGDGSVVRDYVHVTDVVSALLRCMPGNLPEKVFNIGAGRGHSLRELLEEIAAVTGRQPRTVFMEARACDVPVNVLDISRAWEQLNWLPAIPLVEGIEKTWRAVCEKP